MRVYVNLQIVGQDLPKGYLGLRGKRYTFGKTRTLTTDEIAQRVAAVLNAFRDEVQGNCEYLAELGKGGQ